MRYFFDIKRSGDKPDNTAVNFQVNAPDWDIAVFRARHDAAANFGQKPHLVWIIRGGEMSEQS